MESTASGRTTTPDDGEHQAVAPGVAGAEIAEADSQAQGDEDRPILWRVL